MNITTKVEITNRQIVDLFISAIEGGINYWCDSCVIQEPVVIGEKKRVLLYQLDADPDRVVELIFIFFEAGTPHAVGQPEIEKGLQLMASNYFRHFENLIHDNADAETADVFVQCCVFGDIVYG